VAEPDDAAWHHAAVLDDLANGRLQRAGTGHLQGSRPLSPWAQTLPMPRKLAAARAR
jgi:hypothetical protein